jgi:hypothetical protein
VSDRSEEKEVLALLALPLDVGKYGQFRGRRPTGADSRIEKYCVLLPRTFRETLMRYAALLTLLALASRSAAQDEGKTVSPPRLLYTNLQGEAQK